ncbi:MAG: UvrD-helicase domain-containing protein, partial [Proteobacteria bacterium]|nr:UvrD-helicase domain-containing protein [Pseudomonadota bacterium]
RAIGLDEQFMKARAALALISQAKNQGRGPQDFYREATEQNSTRLAVVFERYQALLQSSNALDFDDLLLEAVRLLRSSEAVRETVRGRFQYVMVDEYQDTNRPQYDLMQLVAGEHRNLCVVGDEDQSIYSWRGANIRNILDFEKDYPGARVIRLEQNYRSTKRILAAASAVVANNLDRKGKNLWTDSEDGSPVYHYRARDGGEEASFVARYVDRYLRDHAGKTAAVLYRTNAQSRQIEEALRRIGPGVVLPAETRQPTPGNARCCPSCPCRVKPPPLDRLP